MSLQPVKLGKPGLPRKVFALCYKADGEVAEWSTDSKRAREWIEKPRDHLEVIWFMEEDLNRPHPLDPRRRPTHLEKMKTQVAQLFQDHPLPWRRTASYVLDANDEHVLGSSEARKFLCQAPGYLMQLMGEIELLKKALEDA